MDEHFALDVDERLLKCQLLIVKARTERDEARIERDREATRGDRLCTMYEDACTHLYASNERIRVLEARIGRLQAALDEANARDANGREQASKNALWYATELRQQSELIASLRKYAGHAKWCKINPWIYPSPECSCGLNNLLRSLPRR